MFSSHCETHEPQDLSFQFSELEADCFNIYIDVIIFTVAVKPMVQLLRQKYFYVSMWQ